MDKRHSMLFLGYDVNNSEQDCRKDELKNIVTLWHVENIAEIT